MHSTEKSRDTTFDDEKYDMSYRDQGHPLGKICVTAHSTPMS